MRPVHAVTLSFRSVWCRNVAPSQLLVLCLQATDRKLLRASSDPQSGIDIHEHLEDATGLTIDGNTDAAKKEKRIDWYAVADVVKRPRLVFDGRNIVQPEKLVPLGFCVESVGKANCF